MSEQVKVKLSELPNETLLSYEDSHHTWTSEELREEIIKGGHVGSKKKWYVVTSRRWKPDAKYMIQSFIDQQYDEMYEDWDERAMDCVKEEHYQRIQDILDEAFSGDSATVYWVLDGPKVDIFS